MASRDDSVTNKDAPAFDMNSVRSGEAQSQVGSIGLVNSDERSRTQRITDRVMSPVKTVLPRIEPIDMKWHHFFSLTILSAIP